MHPAPPIQHAVLFDGGMTRSDQQVHVGIGALDFADMVSVARHDATIVLDEESLAAVADSRAIIESLAAETRPH